MRWIILADKACCRIYQTDKRLTGITLLTEINHPENRLKSSALATDRFSNHNSPHTDSQTILINQFALEIASVLNKGRNDHFYDKLIIVMGPDMRGLLYRHLDKHIKRSIFQEIRKDMIHIHRSELLKFLRLYISG